MPKIEVQTLYKCMYAVTRFSSSFLKEHFYTLLGLLLVQRYLLSAKTPGFLLNIAPRFYKGRK